MSFDAERFERFEEAAIHAEYQTGETESSDAEAKANILVRLARMTMGFVLLALGLAMMVLPGPGAVVTAAGLVVLSRDVAWADRALRWLRKKAPGIPEDGKIPRSTIVISVMLMAAAALMVYYLRANYDLPLLG